MANWKHPGSKWWKVDFQTHTPESDDYGKNSPDQAALKQRTPREWLLDYMKAGLDCVAITDHNSGIWIDRLKDELKRMQEEEPDGFRPLFLFPGVELSVNPGVHILAIFGQEKTSSDLDSLLDAAGYRGAKGKTDAVTDKNLGEIIEAIVKAGGMVIPAHVEQNNGVFKELHGCALQQILENKNIFAIESVGSSAEKPELSISAKSSWTKVAGSNAHHPSGQPGERFPGSHFTWVKMGKPDLEGLRLALLDGASSVIPSEKLKATPNSHAAMLIEAIGIKDAKYLGRPDLFTASFNPWINAIIGGRGTGKSTLIEFIRIAMRRENELPEDLKTDFKKYSQVDENRNDTGLLTRDTKIRIVYRKNGVRYRVQWSVNGEITPIEEQQANGEWKPSEGDIPQRFPIRMYSQKQIFQLAKDPLALMRIIDDAQEMDLDETQQKIKIEENRYLALSTKVREIAVSLPDESRLKGELEDIKRQLALFEKGDDAKIYKNRLARKRQENALEQWEMENSKAGEILRQIADQLKPEEIEESVFDIAKTEDGEILALTRQISTQMTGLADSLRKMAVEADKIIANWRQKKNISLWQSVSSQISTEYNQLQDRLTNEGITDPSIYGVLLQRKQLIEKQLKDITGRREQINIIQKQAADSLEQLQILRRQITQKRVDFLKDALQNNRFVKIKVIPYGATENLENEFRKLIQRPDITFEKEIGTPTTDGLLGALYKNKPKITELETRIKNLKKQIRNLAENHEQETKFDHRFPTHLAKLPPEALDRLDLWFPEDSLEIEYSDPTSGNSDTFYPIKGGSPGQKTAALLAFLLTYGHEPLILDQPEDDLDNHLIYNLVVKQLREIKQKRQVIVVTHNPNIVVNADAELVIALEVSAGQTRQAIAGCLQEKNVRRKICLILEGGKEALAQRYRRIIQEVGDV